MSTSKTKHTPGPWVLSDYYSDCLTVTDKDGFEIVDVKAVAVLQGYSEKLSIDHWANSPKASRELSEEEFDANTRLIAAAPELLRALAETLRRLEWHNQQHGVAMDDVAWKKGRAAIRKATGKVSKIDKWVRTETPAPQVQMAIELTPTWVEVLPVLLHGLEFCDSDTRSTAEVELQLMARNADAYVEAVKRIAQYQQVIADIEAVIEAAKQ